VLDVLTNRIMDRVSGTAKHLVNQSRDGRDVMKGIIMIAVEHFDPAHPQQLVDKLMITTMLECFVNVCLPEGSTDVEAFKTKMLAEIDKCVNDTKSYAAKRGAEFSSFMSGDGAPR
jgi:hypothetical protein